MAARRRLYLGLDLGTTNVKALVVDDAGRFAASASRPVTVRHGAGGAAEQDIEQIWQATVEAIAEAAGGAGGGARSAIRAIGVSSQGGALQVLDAAGRPCGPVIGWQDTRGEPWGRELTSRLGGAWFSEHTGFPRCAGAPGQLLRLRSEGSLPAGFRIAFVGDIVVGRLCGRPAHEFSSLSEPCLANPSLGREDPDLLAEIGLSAAQLPDLVSAGEAAGGLLGDVAARLGLDAGIPVGPAVHDQYAAAIGCGAVKAGDTMFGAGTAWVLLSVGAALAPPVAGIALVGRHPVAGRYGQMLSMVNGGSSLSWVVRTLNLGTPAVEEIDGLLRSVPDGSAGLRFRPLLSAGGGQGLPAGRAGRLDGLRLEHTSAHILRATVEGLACELGRYLELMARGRVGVERLVMCGRAAASEVTPGIIADTTGLPVDCSALPETGSLGAAVLARLIAPAEGGGSPPALAALADEMKPKLRRVAPGPGRAAAAARLREYAASLAAPG